MKHTRNSIKSVLKERKLAPKKRFGQNFLVHQYTIESILDHAAPGAEDTIIEFGVGLGSLTLPLAQRVRQVIGIEVDAGIVKMHQEQKSLPENVTLIHQDLLKSDLNELHHQTGAKLKIIANLPYSISNPVLFKLIENKEILDYAVLMLQKEVADRLTAAPRTKEYGILSVLLATCATVTQLMKIGPEQFHPRPKVDSVVVKIDFSPAQKNARKFPPYNHSLLHALVKGAFQQRRKTLVNVLYASGIGRFSKMQISAMLLNLDIPPNTRPEQLTVEQYVSLAVSYEHGMA